MPRECNMCGGQMRETAVVMPLTRSGVTVRIHGVPAHRCANCGETWLHAKAVRRTDELLRLHPRQSDIRYTSGNEQWSPVVYTIVRRMDRGGLSEAMTLGDLPKLLAGVR